MFKHNGLIYLNEIEWNDPKIRAKYPDALLATTYEKEYGSGIYKHKRRFETVGYNRKQRREKYKR